MTVVIVRADADDCGVSADRLEEPHGVGVTAMVPNGAGRTAPRVAITPCQSDTQTP